MDGVARSLAAALATPTAPPLPPGASHWDRLPVELRDEVDSHNCPTLVWFQRGRPLQAELDSLSIDARHRLWTQALESDWQGDLATLPRMPWDHALTLRIVSRGMLERVRACVPEFNSSNQKAVEARDVAVCRLAIRRGWADLLEPLRFELVASAAALEGATQVLQVLREADLNIGDSSHLAGLAARDGHLETVQWLHSFRPADPLEEGVMEDAAGSGSLDLVVWLRRRAKGHHLREPLNIAAANGHLHIVEWLAKNWTGQCEPAAFIKACKNGHADVLDFLRVQYPRVYRETNSVTYRGAQHVATLEWLRKHKPQFVSERMLQSFVFSSNVEAADWIVKNTGARVTREMLEFSFRRDSVAMIKWMIVDQQFEIDFCKFNFGSQFYNTRILAWLIRRDRDLASILAEQYVASGNGALVEWLHVRFPGSITQRTLMVAARAKSAKMLKFLLDLCRDADWDLAAARVEAVERGNTSAAAAIEERM
ncbi:hypothetical protein HK105_204984 [Polyrhizophydium stewartii]|uniref:Ankyrin repeat protein n=1 Tax=Polyrhizophydium stewartii TaxID=2732419 RepID=A0ABR4N751_9FUNG|nr:hypothetical protein HK105_004564 [Polyrhizophydium stewartii]